ncbi:hypothetical protein GOBAR_AA05225 [Gossypium barbadense]|uniref:Uncharacterized protein n=1 Tax=Gossypium barbadense TaxID=3634 RepID=A0A2P5YIF9_GOSBA|nr:hypothetical protein GOBAR_AA05225 [Gossypium barbadense]
MWFEAWDVEGASSINHKDSTVSLVRGLGSCALVRPVEDDPTVSLVRGLGSCAPLRPVGDDPDGDDRAGGLVKGATEREETS